MGETMKHIHILNEIEKQEMVKDVQAYSCSCTCPTCGPEAEEGIEEDPTLEGIEIGVHVAAVT